MLFVCFNLNYFHTLTENEITPLMKMRPISKNPALLLMIRLLVCM